MLTIENKAVQADDLLERAARELQLDKTRYDRMVSAYNTIKDWIEADEKFFKPYHYDVYPHGSVRILTTVKPIGRNEFDLDIAVHLLPGLKRHTPEKIYRELKRRLEEHDLYKKMLEPKNRCLRLNYAGDFHLDILPGVQESESDQNRLLVPDRELGDWVSSNPRGYADWFLRRANMVEMGLLEKSMRAEALPADDYDFKKPLQRAVQLIKRDRDIYFEKNYTNYKTSSIVLTTLAGQLYSGQDSIFDSIDHIISTVVQKMTYSYGRFKVLNPVNAQEDFTDKWEQEPDYYDAFRAFVQHLHQQWQTLKQGQGVLNEHAILNDLFGKELMVRAQQSRTSEIERQRSERGLRISQKTGILTSAAGALSSKIPSNTFFGS
jgi:Second Messenger Oligonucleotide or Dinucleotide Synthetase domain